MRLHRAERDYYVVQITTNPVLVGPWEASFDGGDTWIVGVESDGNWTWLVAGPDFDAAAVSMDPADTAATVTRSVVPVFRNPEDPVLDIQSGPRITLVEV